MNHLVDTLTMIESRQGMNNLVDLDKLIGCR